MKRNIFVLLAMVLTIIGLALPLNMAFAKGPTANGRAGITRQFKAGASANMGKLKKALKAAKQQTKHVTTAQATDPCATDTPDDQEVNDGADTDTDNVDLQCGDQSGPDEQVEDASGSDTGTVDTDSVQDQTPGSDATEQPMPAQSK